MVLREALPDFGIDNLLNRGDITVLTDSNWSRGLVLRGQLIESDLIEVFVVLLTKECWRTFSENYGES